MVSKLARLHTTSRCTIRVLAMAMLLGWLGLPGQAHADDTERARALLERGDDYLAKGDARRDKGREQRAVSYYEKALASYQEAYQLVPKTTIFLAIANAESRLGMYKQAIEHYQKVIAEVDTPEVVALAKEGLQAMAVHMGTLQLSIEPAGAELSIDAELRGVAPLDGPVLVAPGEHTVTITAEGYTPFETVLTMEPGSRVEQAIALEKMPVLVKKPTNLDEERDDSPLNLPESRWTKAPSKTPLVIGGVATGVLVAASVTTLILGSRTDPDTGEANTTLQLVGVIAGVAALGGAGYTTYHYFGVYRPKKARAGRPRQAALPKVWLAPYVHGEGAGVAVGGLF